MAHREDGITPVHDEHDETSNPSEVIRVAENHESNGNNMVGHHLPVVLSTSFGIDDKDRMEVK